MVRFKNRYLILQLAWRDSKTDTNTGEADLLAAFRDAIKASLGSEGLSKAQPGLAVRWYSPLSSVALVRCSRQYQPQCLQAISRLTNITYRPVAVRLLRHTGAFRVAKRVAARHDKQLLLDRRLSARQEEQAAAASQRLADLEI